MNPDTCTEAVGEGAASTVPSAKTRPSNAEVLALLEKLAALYPALFGAEFLPLKRGIFHDIQQAHPDMFPKDLLKAALAFHTRSTRYLVAASSGQQRHDLQGQAVEPMAPEHIHHALLEVFRRRQARSPKEDLRPKLRQRMLVAFEQSGLTPDAYAELVRGRDDSANTLLDEVLAQAAQRAAKREALQRAFVASGQGAESFAAMYGLDPREVAKLIQTT